MIRAQGDGEPSEIEEFLSSREEGCGCFGVGDAKH